MLFFNLKKFPYFKVSSRLSFPLFTLCIDSLDLHIDAVSDISPSSSKSQIILSWFYSHVGFLVGKLFALEITNLSISFKKFNLSHASFYIAADDCGLKLAIAPLQPILLFHQSEQLLSISRSVASIKIPSISEPILLEEFVSQIEADFSFGSLVLHRDLPVLNESEQSDSENKSESICLVPSKISVYFKNIILHHDAYSLSITRPLFQFDLISTTTCSCSATIPSLEMFHSKKMLVSIYRTRVLGDIFLPFIHQSSFDVDIDSVSISLFPFMLDLLPSSSKSNSSSSIEIPNISCNVYDLSISSMLHDGSVVSCVSRLPSVKLLDNSLVLASFATFSLHLREHQIVSANNLLFNQSVILLGICSIHIPYFIEDFVGDILEMVPLQPLDDKSSSSQLTLKQIVLIRTFEFSFDLLLQEKTNSLSVKFESAYYQNNPLKYGVFDACFDLIHDKPGEIPFLCIPSLVGSDFDIHVDSIDLFLTIPKLMAQIAFQVFYEYVKRIINGEIEPRPLKARQCTLHPLKISDWKAPVDKDCVPARFKSFDSFNSNELFKSPPKTNIEVTNLTFHFGFCNGISVYAECSNISRFAGNNAINFGTGYFSFVSLEMNHHLASWNSSKLVITKGPPEIDFNFDLIFDNVVLYLDYNCYFGDILEFILIQWKGFKKWRNPLIFKPDLELPEDVDIGNFNLLARSIQITLEDDPLESACIIHRNLSHLQPPFSYPLLPNLFDYKSLATITCKNFHFSLSIDPNTFLVSDLISKMKNLDSCPEEVRDEVYEYGFLELWSRFISLGGSNFKLSLRDFPTPVLASRTVLANGTLLFSQNSCPKQFIVLKESCYPKYSIPRTGLIPMRLFHDLSIAFKTPKISYCVGYDGAFSALSLAIDRLTTTLLSRPGGNLMYWDALRYFMHGKMNIEASNAEISVFATPNPYDTTRVHVSASGLFFSIDTGAFEVKLRDAQTSIFRYGEMHSFLFLPKLYAGGNCQWETFDSMVHPNAHYIHHTYCLDEYSGRSPFEYDLFDKFRSVSLGYKFKIVIEPNTDFVSRKAPHPIFKESKAVKQVDFGRPSALIEWQRIKWFLDFIDLLATPPHFTQIKPLILVQDMLPIKPSIKPKVGSVMKEYIIEISVSSPEIELLYSNATGRGVQIIQLYSKFLGSNFEVVHQPLEWEFQNASIDAIKLRVKMLVQSENNLDESFSSGVLDESVLDALEMSPFSKHSPILQFAERNASYLFNAYFFNYRSPTAITSETRPNLFKNLSETLSKPSISKPNTLNLSFSPEALRKVRRFSTTLEPLEEHPAPFDLKLRVPSCGFSGDPEVKTIIQQFESTQPPFSMFNNLDLSNLIPDDNEKDMVTRKSDSTIFDPHKAAKTSRLLEWERKRLSLTKKMEGSFLQRDVFNDCAKFVFHDMKLLWTNATATAVDLWIDIFSDGLSSSVITAENDNFPVAQTPPPLHLIPPNFENINLPTPVAVSEPADFNPSKISLDMLQLLNDADTKGTVEISTKGAVERGKTDDDPYDDGSKEPYVRRYVFDIIRSQVNYTSDQTSSSCVVCFDRARVQGGGFDVIDLFDHDCDDDIIHKPVFYKTEISAVVIGARGFVGSTNIDVSTKLEWLPMDVFNSSNYNSGVLRRVIEHCNIFFSYSSDSELPEEIDDHVAKKSVEEFMKCHERYRVVQPNLIDITNSATKREITSTIKIHVPSILGTLDSQEFWVTYNCFTQLLLDEHDEPKKNPVPLPNDPYEIRELIKEAENDRSIRVRTACKKSDNICHRTIDYSVGEVSWDMIPQYKGAPFMHVSIDQLHGAHSYFFGSRQMMLFEIHKFSLQSRVSDSPFKELLVPHPDKWLNRDIRHDKMITIRTEEANFGSEKFPQLFNLNIFEHFEIKVFPLQIQFPHDHYILLREYFFPSEVLNEVFDMQAAFTPTRKVSFFNKSSAPLIPVVSPSPETTSPLELNLFKYVRINEVEFLLSYLGGYIDLDRLEFTLHSLFVQKKLWTWKELLECIEDHSTSQVWRAAKKILGHKFKVDNGSQCVLM